MSGPSVMVGQLLLILNPEMERTDLWTVKAIRKLQSGRVKLTLISADRSCSIEATATWDTDEIREPWRLWVPSKPDRGLIYARLGDLAAESPGEGRNDG